MSSQVKKYQVKLARKVVSNEITMGEARARYGRAMGGNRKPARKQLVDAALRGALAVIKSARSAAVKAVNPGAERAALARQVLAAAAGESRNPVLRENIRPGGGAA